MQAIQNMGKYHAKMGKRGFKPCFLGSNHKPQYIVQGGVRYTPPFCGYGQKSIYKRSASSFFIISSA